MSLINRFHQIDIDGKGSVGKQDVIKAVQDQGEASYDQARETLKEVNLDSSGRVELEDYVEVSESQVGHCSSAIEEPSDQSLSPNRSSSLSFEQVATCLREPSPRER